MVQYSVYYTYLGAAVLIASFIQVKVSDNILISYVVCALIAILAFGM
jgi:hypothetical protein